MVKRLIDIDNRLLREAAAILGASTMKETINSALQEVVHREQRRRHADRLSEMRGLDLDRPDVMRDAWR